MTSAWSLRFTLRASWRTSLMLADSGPAFPFVDMDTATVSAGSAVLLLALRRSPPIPLRRRLRPLLYALALTTIVDD